MTSLKRNQYDATVAANQFLCREHYRLTLSLPEFPATKAGQFIQVSCRDLRADYSPEYETIWEPGKPLDFTGRELLNPLAMLRRPFSLAGRVDPDAGVTLDVIHRVVGVGTDWLAKLAVGDEVQILGPLGNRFAPPPDDGVALLVGGGVGIPPMLYLAAELSRTQSGGVLRGD